MTEISQAPLLSVVAVSRNDNHGGSLRDRMQRFVNGFFAQCRRHGLRAELILVEWNPPFDRAPLREALDWPADFGPATARIITVPADVHGSLENAGSLPLFQMIGKNVGIRRSSGRYVLATNVDLLFNDALIRYMCDALKPGRMLRVDRYDVPADISCDPRFDHVLGECDRRFFRVNTRFGSFDVAERRLTGINNNLISSAVSLWLGLRILGAPQREPWPGWAKAVLAHLVIGLQITGLLLRYALSQFDGKAARAAAGKILAPFRAVGRWLLAFLAETTSGAGAGSYWLFSRILYLVRYPSTVRDRGPIWVRKTPLHVQRLWRRVELAGPRLAQKLSCHGRSFRSAIGNARGHCSRMLDLGSRTALHFAACLIPQKRSEAKRLLRSHRLHTNGCGDFTLLSREDWFRMRGYPEWPIFSWHLDSVLMFAANANDIREIALGSAYRLFHIDHSNGWSPSGSAELFDRLNAKGIPYLNNRDVSRLRDEFNRDPAAAVVNDVNWGLADLDLPDHPVTPASGGWERKEPTAVTTPNLSAAVLKTPPDRAAWQ